MLDKLKQGLTTAKQNRALLGPTRITAGGTDTPAAQIIPLSHTIIRRLAALFAALIITIILISYNYSIEKSELQFQDQLREYIIQRGKRESELFSLAKDNLLLIQEEFVSRCRSNISHDTSRFPGLTAVPGLEMEVWHDTLPDPHISRQVTAARDLILEYGRAWRSRFVNLWFVSGHGVAMMYNLRDLDNTQKDMVEDREEWLLKTGPEKNPDRKIIWTGLYFDSGAGQWRISAALPLYLNNVHIGTIGTDLECRQFFDRNLSDSPVSSYSVVLSKTGRIIVHPYKIAESISTRNPTFTVALAKDPNLSIIYEKVRKITSFPAIIDLPENEEILAVTRIEGPDWYLVSVYYKALHDDQIRKNILFTIGLTLGSLAAALFTIYMVVRAHISLPLRMVTKAVEQFNDLPGRANTPAGSLTKLTAYGNRPDEVGLFVRTFIRMGTRLTRMYQDLENARKNLEQQVAERTRDLVMAKRAAEHANMDKTRFLANMSHELRTPLNVIIGFSRIMARDPAITREQRENIGFIRHSGDQLLSLINDVLDMSKIESGKAAFYGESFDLHSFLDNIIIMFRHRAHEKNLVLTLEKTDSLPQFINTDKRKLRQVIVNILGNAISFTDKGSVTIMVKQSSVNDNTEELPADYKPDLWLRFSITDTGIGIDEADFQIIFNQFAQGVQGRSRENSTGLGLAISKNFIRIMGGRLKVKSKLGAGSTFFFDLPVQKAGQADINQTSNARWPNGLEKGQPDFHILVVEDHEQTRRVIEKLLSSVGFIVHTAVNGQDGVDQFKTLSPDLVLMDIRMPVMDGLAATRAIKATRAGCDTPVIALTAHAFDNERQVILSSGCDGFISKPLDEAELFACLAKHTNAVFIYDNTDPVSEKENPSLTVQPYHWASLDPALLKRLKNACSELNQDLTLSVIREIAPKNTGLAAALDDMAREFRFDAIVEALEQKNIPGDPTHGHEL